MSASDHLNPGQFGEFTPTAHDSETARQYMGSEHHFGYASKKHPGEFVNYRNDKQTANYVNREVGRMQSGRTDFVPPYYQLNQRKDKDAQAARVHQAVGHYFAPNPLAMMQASNGVSN